MPLKHKSRPQLEAHSKGVKDRGAASPKEVADQQQQQPEQKREVNMEESLMEVNMKLNAIMSYLGIKNPCPPKGGSQQLASSEKEKFFVFRNDVYDNEGNGLLMGSQSFSDDAHFSPRSHFSDDSQVQDDVHAHVRHGGHHLESEKLKRVAQPANGCRLHTVDRGSFGSETATDYSDSLGSHSCSTTYKSQTDNESKGLTPELPSAQRTQNGGYNKMVGSSPHTGQQANISDASRVPESNNGELSWRDIVPIIGGSDHEVEFIGKDHKSGHPQGHKEAVRATAKSKSRSSPPSNVRKSSSAQSLKSASRVAPGQRSLSRRELLRTDTAQEQAMMDEVAVATKNDTTTNREVVIQIQQKIMELRRMESLDKKQQEPSPAPRPRQKEDPPWISEAWDLLCENHDDINGIGELEDAFSAPPRFSCDL